MRIIFGTVLAVMLQSCASDAVHHYESPRETVMRYCNGDVHDISSDFFAIESDTYSQSTPMPILWNDCVVISESFHTDAHSHAEVVSEVTYESGTTERFRYMLRRFDDGWRIVSYHAIADPEPDEDS